MAFEITGIDELVKALEQLVETEIPNIANEAVTAVSGEPPAQEDSEDEQSSEGVASNQIDGVAARANGFPPFDIKPGMLRSPKVKIGKAGQRYINVPIKNKNSISGQPDFRRLSSQWQDKKGRMRGTPEWKWWHPGIKAGGDDETNEQIEQNIDEGIIGAIKRLFSWWR